jgi:hypothetical protein
MSDSTVEVSEPYVACAGQKIVEAKATKLVIAPPNLLTVIWVVILGCLAVEMIFGFAELIDFARALFL